jgi:hypothetical protein
MIFANGVRKAGTFKDNVLIEILPEESHTDLRKDLPAEFQS